MTELRSPSETIAALERIGEWKFRPNEISRTYTFATFTDAVEFVNRMAAHSEEVDHHPDILVRYRKVRLTVTTHSHSGVTDRDLAWAQAAEGVYGDMKKKTMKRSD